MIIEIDKKKYRCPRKGVWFRVIGEIESEHPYQTYVGRCRKPARLDIRHFLCPTAKKLFDAPMMTVEEVAALAIELTKPKKKKDNDSNNDWPGAEDSADFYGKLELEILRGLK